VRTDGGVEERLHFEAGERERDVVGIARRRARKRTPACLRLASERLEAGDLAEVGAEQLAIDELLLAHERVCVCVGQRAEKLPHDFNPRAAGGSAKEVLADGRHTAPREKNVPRALVMAHGVDDRAVDVEDEGDHYRPACAHGRRDATAAHRMLPGGQRRKGARGRTVTRPA
jgi:hypothetical protein